MARYHIDSRPEPRYGVRPPLSPFFSLLDSPVFLRLASLPERTGPLRRSSTASVAEPAAVQGCAPHSASATLHGTEKLRPSSDAIANGVPGDDPLNNPALIVFVRFKSSLTLEEAARIAEERLPEFQALAGLQQKYYLQDAATGEFVGVYVWRSSDDFAAYKDSELRASIGAAYKVVGEPRVEVFRVMKLLRDAAA